MLTMRLVIVEREPLNAETPPDALAEPLTPAELFYVRNHFAVPRIDPHAWRLRVEGAVERALELSLEDVQQLPSRTITVTLECAGNGRTLLTPTPGGTPWRLGAVGTARFTGAPLSLLLDRAGLRPEAVELLFVGADQGEVEPGRVEPFARSLPVEEARGPDVLLAWAMNDEPLTADHGFPVRLVVPGWYGMASVKWLARIVALEQAFEGYFQREHYRYVQSDDPVEDAPPVTRARVRSLIVRPADGARLPLAPVEFSGIAWSGYGPVTRVEVSIDGGASWAAAELGADQGLYAARPWSFRWHPPQPGRYTVLARATDALGNSQPLSPQWNRQGYGNNACQAIQVVVGQED
ncbi:sulfite oxidase [Thermomicrobiaceae bacterium CFH 74404]|uniref:Sulfite oxidase n=1 Tax=Thermalbibacter longus TaxID=2951981 RepID=A0AA41WFM4_9BACT|nr:sulfite oxidase [Thermalbibacter longus]MCM8749218.1 sulfite oxidase [Thermalbibacter longus]